MREKVWQDLEAVGFVWEKIWLDLEVLGLVWEKVWPDLEWLVFGAKVALASHLQPTSVVKCWAHEKDNESFFEIHFEDSHRVKFNAGEDPWHIEDLLSKGSSG